MIRKYFWYPSIAVSFSWFRKCEKYVD